MIRKIVVGSVCFAALIAVAVLLGTEAATLLSERQMLKERGKITEVVLREMGTIRMGERLIDFPLLDLEAGDTIQISTLAQDRLLLVFAQSSCGMCDAQLNDVQDLLKSGSNGSRVAIVVGDGVEEAIEYERKHEMNCLFLHDGGNRYRQQYRIMDSPFNLIVSDSGVISEAVVGRLTKQELFEIME